MPSKFYDLYEKVIDESKFGLESVFTRGLDFCIHKRKHKHLSDFFKYCIFIRDSDDIPCIFDGIGLIDEETHPEVKYGSSVIQKIKSMCCNDLRCFPVKWLKESVSKVWKHHGKLSRLDDSIKVFYICDDFSKPRAMLRRIFTSLCGESFGDLIHSEDFDDVCKKFIRESSSFQGFLYHANDAWLLCFNQTSFTVKTVSHELTHLMQSLLGINLLGKKIVFKCIN